MAWRSVAAKAVVVAIAVLVPALFVGNGLYLLTHGWFVRAEYARPGFPDDEFGMRTPERTRLAEVGLYSILPWHRDGIGHLERARLDDGSLAFDAHELRHMTRRAPAALDPARAARAVPRLARRARRGAADTRPRPARAVGGRVHDARAVRVRRLLAAREPGVVPDRLPHDLLQRRELALRRRGDAAAPLPRPVLERHDAAARGRRAAAGGGRARRDALVAGAHDRTAPGPRRRTERAMAGRTQEALYAEIDLELSWSEDALPQAERTKHVHGLHPYLGKFVPQLVEVFLAPLLRARRPRLRPVRRVGDDARRGERVRRRRDRLRHLGVQLPADPGEDGALLARRAGARAARRARRGAARHPRPGGATPWLEQWFAPRALGELLAYRAAVATAAGAARRSVGRVILARAARSARRTTHFDLDFPAAPTTEPYWCFKHKRTCRPTEEAAKFLTPLHGRHDPPHPRVRARCAPSAR